MYKRQLKSSTCKRRLNVYFFINFLLVESLKNLANQQSHSGSNNEINFRNTKQAKNSWPSFGYVRKSRVKKSVSKRVVWCLIPLKIFLFFLSLSHSRNTVRMQQWGETKFKNSKPLPYLHSREVWVQVRRRGLQTSTLFKTKITSFATLSETGDTTFDPEWFVCIAYRTKSFFTLQSWQ